MNLTIEGGAAPFREAVSAAIEGMARSIDEVIDADVHVIVCDDAESWQRLSRCAVRPEALTVAVVTDLDVAEYRRALRLGVSGVVYIDTSSAIIASVVRAALSGEVVLPAFVARALADVDGEPATRALTPRELAVSQAVASGGRITDIASELNYSERTIRRLLQNAMLKVGAQNRIDLALILSADCEIRGATGLT